VLLRELDRALGSNNFFMETDAFHAMDQTYPTEILRSQLAVELDVVLGEQIKDGERARKRMIDSSDSEGEVADDASGGGLSGKG
jgi:hypothetical protein